MTDSRVTSGGLTDKADRSAFGRSETSETLTRLQGQIAALVSQAFVTDRSSGAFNDACNRFTSGAQNAIGGLDDLAAFLRTTATSPQDVDTQIASRIGR